MLSRIIECLRHREALDQNVYEGCFRPAAPPQSFPDFTRGHWQTTKPPGIIS